MSDRPNTDTQTTDDVNAILAGMVLPRQLQPGYRSDLPPQLLNNSQLPPELRGTVVPPGTFRTAQADPVDPPPATPPPATPPTSQPSVTPGGDQPIASPPTPSTPATPPTARSVTPGSNAPMLSPTPPIPQLQPPQRPGVWQDRPDVVWQNRPPQQQVPQPIPQQQHVSDTQQKFIETYGPLAEQAGKALGVDPRLILGQWALESGWGVGPGAAQVGNMAGIKGRDGQYTRYNSPEEFADAYVRFLRDNPRYRGAMGAGTNADQFFGGLKRAGYFGADLNGYMQGVFRNIGVFGTVAQGQGPTVQPQASYPPAEPRDSGDWGHPPPMQGQGGRGPDGQPAPGQLPQPSAFGRIMSGLAPLLLAIGSLALRLPLSSAITAYGAMARAQQNGEEQEYQRNRTRWRDQLGEATAQQALESRAASDAFSEYGHNNPQGLQQQLMRVALQYNDPTMYRMAEQGDLNGIYQMQAKRDALNQDLTKTHRAAEEEADRQAQDAAVKAMDNQWHDKFVKDNGREPTADEAAIAHNEHIGQAGQAGTKTVSEQEGPVLNVIDADGKPTGQQVRTGRSGGYFDPNTKQPVQLGPGETVQQVPRQTQGTGGREGQQVYNVLGADDKPTGRQVRLGQQGGLYDTNGQPTTLAEGEHLQPLGRPSAASGTSPEGMAVYDVVGADGRPTGKQVRMAKNGGLFDLNTPPQPVQLSEGETVRPVSRQAQPQPASAVPDNWKGAPYTAPPGVDAGLWQQAVNWAEQGRPPTGLGGRNSSMYQSVEPLVPAAMKALGIQSLAEQQLRYDAKRHALNSIETGFGSGVNGRNLISLNTVAEHIALFKQYADALRNGDVQRVNQIRNRLATEAGSPEVIDFALAGRITGDEVVRLLTTTGGTLADREDIASRLASYDSPDQFEGAANTLTNYVRGRYLPLRQQYARGDPERERYFDNNMVTPEARHLFQGPQAPIPGVDEPQQSPQQPQPQPQGAMPARPSALPQGKTQWDRDSGHWRVDGKEYDANGNPL